MVDDVRDKSAANQNDRNFENVIENEHFLVVAIDTSNTIDTLLQQQMENTDKIEISIYKFKELSHSCASL